MAKNLVIVESPAKAKTIEKFLGKDFIVRSSFGHIRDLPKKKMGVDIEAGTFTPTYEVTDDKKKVIAELKKATKSVETVWLAADEDREGEAIAWHLFEALKLSEKETKRIVFHEITKPAILNAIENPREINKNLVDAQQARRVLDRLVGYELSPVLWKKVQIGLSAGRVQSVSVRLIVERERAIDAFNSESKFKITAEFFAEKGKIFKAELSKKFNDQKSAHKFLEKCVNADFEIKSVEQKPGKKSPSAPFTTSTIQQEASRKLGFSVKQTMVVAQKLYESGKITYMRTDSLNLSDLAVSAAAKEITKTFGAKYSDPKKYKTKSASAQEAHEAIRPTDLSVSEAGSDRNTKRLYDLIYKRTIASQMADAIVEKTVAKISISSADEEFIANGEVIAFDGFLRVYFESTDEEEEVPLDGKMLPPLKKGQILTSEIIVGRETFSRPPARFTEASLVKKMEEMGIGRPSTYAPTIFTIQNRGYVEKKDSDGFERKYATLILQKNKIIAETKTEITGAERSKLFPTEIGGVVNDFLVKNFDEVVDFKFTAIVENEFDSVASGKQVWNKMIADFYKEFHKNVEKAADVSREEASGTRELGIDPKSKRPVSVRIGRFGPLIQIGTKDDEEKPKFASLPPGKKMDEIDLEAALKMFEFPILVGEYEKTEVLAAIGRFGPYLKFGALNISIPKDESPTEITLERSIELIVAKQKFEAEKNVKIFEDSSVKILNGRYGVYITDGKKNAKIPKEFSDNPGKLTLKQCEELIAKAPAKKRRFTKK
jgi:DNA topoisomerase-1